LETFRRVAKETQEFLQKCGIRCGFVHSKTPRIERQEILAKLQNGEISVIVATPVLDEGIDIPDIRAVILMSSSRSLRVLIQRIGRALRKTKSVAFVYDILFRNTHEIKSFYIRKKNLYHALCNL